MEYYFDAVKTFMENTRFNFDEYSSGEATFSTRQNGDGYNETYGEKDLNEAYRIKKELDLKYKDKEVEIRVSTCDEWVLMFIKVARPKQIKIEYVWNKLNAEGCGGSTFTSRNHIEALIKSCDFDSVAIKNFMHSVDHLEFKKHYYYEITDKVDICEKDGKFYSIQRKREEVE